jgi:hypothetical protein
LLKQFRARTTSPKTAVNLDDPVARNLIGRHDEDGLLVLCCHGACWVLRRLEREAVTGHIGGKVSEGRSGCVAAAAEALVSCLAPYAIPRLPAPLRDRDMADRPARGGSRPLEWCMRCLLSCDRFVLVGRVAVT